MNRLNQLTPYIYLVFVGLIAYFTYFSGYQNPPKQFWDENYHIASAQKYIDGVVYMEPHPPLGKLFIALGEYIVSPNETIEKSYFTKTDYIKDFPHNFSFEGYRLFPTVFATINGILFFGICLLILKNSHFAFLFSSLYLFENAFIVHSRSAMLESTQMFFVLLAILYFISIDKSRYIKTKDYALLGLIIGLGVAVKLNSLIMIMVVFFLPFFEYNHQKQDLKRFFYLTFVKYFTSGVVLAISFVGIFYIHFAITDTMPTNSKYNISKEYQEIIQSNQTANILNIPIMLKDNLEYIKNYSKGVPRYDPCKAGENGSFCLTWPFGNKSINYRWEKDSGEVRYLYLQGNPIVWFGAFFAVLLSFVLVIGRYVFKNDIKNKEIFFYIAIFLSMYISYMFVMYQIQRVMYLYHYFIPLMFGIILILFMFRYVFENEIINNNKLLVASVIIFAINIFIVYSFFAPLSYYEPLSTSEFEQRNWFDFWKLKSIQ